MRKSSATVARPRTPMCSGTLKSTRTSTRFPSNGGKVPQERDAAEGVHQGQAPTSTVRSTSRLE